MNKKPVQIYSAAMPGPIPKQFIDMVAASDHDALAARLAEAVALLERWHKTYHGTVTYEPEEIMECVDDDTTTFLHTAVSASGVHK